jgi:hypothetical protein
LRRAERWLAASFGAVLRERPRALSPFAVALLAGALFAGGCGADDETASTPKATTTARTQTSPKSGPPGPRETAAKGRLVRNPKRAAIERTVEQFVGAVERSDAARVCRLLGRPRGTLEGCVDAAGIDLRMFPSSDELSIARITVKGSRARAGLAGGQTFTLRRVGRRWLITGLRP